MTNEKFEKFRVFAGNFTFLNFLAAILGMAYFGGDALNGKEENGHFFLSYHGKLTEVSENVFIYSQYHCASIFVSIGIVLILHLMSKSAAKKSS
ncbi:MULTISPECIES: hypothetical protein [unclassified Duganella]|uniref:hypothetical protein n=1 Tax=unclassified Duganella TaxID=2636909 RepID=UPI000E346FCE|nr:MULTISPECIES: hypothetical protein [unclassified Duganella]RFP15051.1 hypothetical protein D0T23_13765 [Duganella sp. BJB475]RFP31401.1 hypothetical protein D0T21_16145 [Duganella sp. BJB476]